MPFVDICRELIRNVEDPNVANASAALMAAGKAKAALAANLHIPTPAPAQPPEEQPDAIQERSPETSAPQASQGGEDEPSGSGEVGDGNQDAGKKAPGAPKRTKKKA